MSSASIYRTIEDAVMIGSRSALIIFQREKSISIH